MYFGIFVNKKRAEIQPVYNYSSSKSDTDI